MTKLLYNLIPNIIYRCEAVDNTGKSLATKYIKPTGNVRMIYMNVVSNVRDLGGWNAAGGKLAYGKLFRGAEFASVDSTGKYTPSMKSGVSGSAIVLDAPILKNTLGVDVQVDLRHGHYWTENGDIDGIAYYPKSINEYEYAILMDYYYNADVIVNYNPKSTTSTDVKAAYNATVDVLKKIS